MEGCDWGLRPGRLEEDDEEAKAEGGEQKKKSLEAWYGRERGARRLQHGWREGLWGEGRWDEGKTGLVRNKPKSAERNLRVDTVRLA